MRASKTSISLLKSRNFTVVGSSSVKTVADRHRLAVYCNKKCWRAFKGYQHWRPCKSLNPENRWFGYICAIFCSGARFKSELGQKDQDNLYEIFNITRRF